MAVRDAVLLYDLRSCKVIGSEKEVVEASRRMWIIDRLATFGPLLLVPAHLGTGKSWAALKTLPREQNSYRGLKNKPNNAEVRISAEMVDLGTLLEEDLFRGQVRGASMWQKTCLIGRET